jgi:hypothetical protein
LLVSRRGLAGVAARERIERALLVHDNFDHEEVADLRSEDGPILRIIARENLASGAVPAVRAGAIAALARLSGPENLNALTELALFGSDVYIRSHALMALGQSGLLLAAWPLKDGLSTTEGATRRAAAKGLLELARRCGVSEIKVLMGKTKNVDLAKGLAALESGAPRVPRRRRKSVTQASKPTRRRS